MDILYVEDSDPVRREIEALLRDLPGVDEVASRQGVAAARRTLRDEPYDVWILDFQLEDGTALDLLEDRREAAGPSSTRVVVLTNHATRLVRDRCLEAGADHFFDKSVELDQMLATVASMPRRPGAI